MLAVSHVSRILTVLSATYPPSLTAEKQNSDPRRMEDILHAPGGRNREIPQRQVPLSPRCVQSLLHLLVLGRELLHIGDYVRPRPHWQLGCVSAAESPLLLERAPPGDPLSPAPSHFPEGHLPGPALLIPNPLLHPLFSLTATYGLLSAVALPPPS